MGDDGWVVALVDRRRRALPTFIFGVGRGRGILDVMLSDLGGDASSGVVGGSLFESSIPVLRPFLSYISTEFTNILFVCKKSVSLSFRGRE